jgi:hypothetical protein
LGSEACGCGLPAKHPRNQGLSAQGALCKQPPEEDSRELAAQKVVFTGSSAAWQRACFGSRRSRVQIPPSRPEGTSHLCERVAGASRCRRIGWPLASPTARALGGGWHPVARELYIGFGKSVDLSVTADNRRLPVSAIADNFTKSRKRASGAVDLGTLGIDLAAPRGQRGAPGCGPIWRGGPARSFVITLPAIDGAANVGPPPAGSAR